MKLYKYLVRPKLNRIGDSGGSGAGAEMPNDWNADQRCSWIHSLFAPGPIHMAVRTFRTY